MNIKIDTTIIVGVGIGALLLIANSRKVAAAIVGGAADVATGVVAGTAEGVGSLFGIPLTDPAKCAADKKRGDLWEASFDCPAGDFLGTMWDSITGGAASPAQKNTAPGGGVYMPFPSSPFSLSEIDWASNSVTTAANDIQSTAYAFPVAVAGIRG